MVDKVRKKFFFLKLFKYIIYKVFESFIKCIGHSVCFFVVLFFTKNIVCKFLITFARAI